MGGIRCTDYDEVDVCVLENAVQGAMDPDGDTKSFLWLSAGRGGVTLKDGGKREKIGKREDEWDVEGESGEANTEHTSPNRRWRHVSGRPYRIRLTVQ